MGVPRRPDIVDLRFSSHAWEDYQHWLASDRNILRRLNALIKDTSRSPFEGIGKPEPLKGDLAGWWARRITDEHRLVYRVVGVGTTQVLEIAACRFHY
jgi:toxin YoeB